MLEWKAPAPKAGTKWQEIAAELRAHPGEWARIVKQGSSQLAVAIRKGLYTAFRPPEHWEVTVRDVKSSRADIYLRYIGPPDET